MMLTQRKLEQKSHDNEVLQNNLKQALQREPKRDILSFLIYLLDQSPASLLSTLPSLQPSQSWM